jgi:histidinol-phosphate aminotransferase
MWDFGDHQRLKMRFLHLNESPFAPSPRAIAAAKAALDSMNRYPDIRAHELSAAIAARTGVPASRIIYGCGSDEIIHYLTEVTLDPGTRGVVPAPSFPRYAHSIRMQGAAPVRVRLTRDGACDGSALAAASADPLTRLVFACTPNPPSGGFMDAANLRGMIAAMPDHVLLVIDEAYHEFARHAGAPDVLAALAARRGPWIVLRTFSKAYALAAMRVGYALCGSDEVAEAMRKAMLQFKVTTPALAAALAAYQDDAHLQDMLERTAAGREQLTRGFIDLGLRAYPSAANFVSCDIARPAQQVMEALASRGILIRDWRDPDHMQELRVTIGAKEDNEVVLRALADELG